MNPLKQHFHLLAEYNASANRRLYETCAALSEEERRRDRSAFFRSIHGTLNHILIGDRIWLTRLRGENAPSTGLDAVLYEAFEELRDARRAMDRDILAFIEAMDPVLFDSSVSYVNNEGLRYDDPVTLLLPHWFNHQTHHRGQVHDMICQTDVEPPVLDMHRVIKPQPE